MTKSRKLDSKSLICIDCIGDSNLKKRIKATGKKSLCACCGNTELAVTLDELGKVVDKAYRNFYEPGPEVPEYEVGSDHTTWSQKGNPPQEILENLTEADYEIAEALVDIMSAKERYAVVRDGAAPYYDSTSNYVETRPYSDRYFSIWYSFRDRIRHEKRFFDLKGQELLKAIFEDIGDFSYGGSKPPIKLLDPAKERIQLCRARRATNGDQAREFMKEPWSKIGPPPPKSAKAGRMNPAGISVFYGALKEGTCVAELRPPAGSLVVHALFEPSREIKLLDFTVFDREPSGIDPFDEDEYENLERWRFLESFHEQITRPIQPEEEEIEYVPTQAVADFVRNILSYDGIIYSSAQTEKPEQNIVLFDPEAISPGGEPTDDSTTFFNDIDTIISGIELDHPTKLILRYVEGSASIARVKAANYQYEDIDDEMIL